MNQDSRQRGAGAKSAKVRKIVRPKKQLTQPSAPTPASVEPPKKLEKLSRMQLRELALDELAAVAVDAAKALGQSAKKPGRAERGAGAQTAAAKWLLERVFDLVAAPQLDPSGAQAALQAADHVDELARRRERLKVAIRSQNKDMNK